MNKWLERAILVNIIILIIYIASDYFAWSRFDYDLESAFGSTGSYSNLKIYESGSFAVRVVWVTGILTWETGMTSFGKFANIPNFPLLVFVVAIIANMFLLYKATKETKNS